MNYNTECFEIELICVIAPFGLGSKILKTSKKNGILGGTITLGRGTASGGIWNFLGLSEIKKEIIYMVAEKEMAYHALEKINVEYKLNKPNHGIAFTTSVCSTVGTRLCKCEQETTKRGENHTMYQVINIIVDKGKAEDVIDAAVKAGSKGGTIVNGRGSGIHETSKLFSMEIEPEKEIVIILSEVEQTEVIVSEIRQNLKIDEPGKGIIYIQDVNRTYGVYK